MMFDNLCAFIKDELKEMDRKVASEGKLSGQEIEYADRLSHIKKSLLTVDAMENPGEYRGSGVVAGGYTRRNYNDGYEDGYNDGYERRGYSDDGYSRGRGSGARRDSMGRYAEPGSYHASDDMMMELERLKDMAPNEQVRRRYQDFMKEMKNMM
jgi:hypothetical protein